MNKKVFFIDDEKNVLNSINRLFRPADLEIYLFSDPFEALEKIPEVNPCVVVSDYRMPGMTGIDFFESIKNNVPEAVKIILSAYTDIAVTEAAINKSAVDLFISKPCDDQELIAEVHNAVKLFNLKGRNNSEYGIF
jgi:FixJ family two-component response regulator